MEEAETMARLKSSVIAGTSKVTGMAELKKAVSSLRDSLSPKSEMQELRDEIERIKHLSSTPQRRSNNTPVSAYYNSEKTKGHLHGNKYEANSQIHQLQEVRTRNIHCTKTKSVASTELTKVYEWLTANRLTLNIKKSNDVIFRPHQKALVHQPKLHMFDNENKANQTLNVKIM